MTSKSDSLTITDNRTGTSYEVPISEETIRATDLRQIKTSDEEFGLMTYDPAYMNTASCRSAVTYLDGDNGVLRYRGYPIEQLADKSSFLEVALLLLDGELPSKAALEAWEKDVVAAMPVPDHIEKFIEAFPRDAHPMAMLLAAIAALGANHPEAVDLTDDAVQRTQIINIIGKIATLGAYLYRHSKGLPFVKPDTSKGYSENFLTMLYQDDKGSYTPDPHLVHALDVLLILHADHEQNCSTSAVRSVGSSQVDVYSAVAAGIAALYGPLHGGANEAVLKMLRRIEGGQSAEEFMNGVKEGKERLMGFGHRVYKNYDPRARIIKKACDEVFAVTGVNPLLDLATKLEETALADDYFVQRKLYPNVDFYSGLIYEALGLPAEMFTVMFAIGRAPGWLAQWYEMIHDKEQKISRPRQIFIGSDERDYVEMDAR
ncbi:MAG: citrate synthase [Thermoleophilia bacterium]|nr:citrate synthase [Thermoleophilia bacterium]